MREAFHHVTFQTAHSRLSPRAEISEPAISTLQDVVARGSGTIKGMRFDVVAKPTPHDSDAVFDLALPKFGRMARCWLGWENPDAMRARLRQDLGEAAAAMVPDDAPFLMAWLDASTAPGFNAPQRLGEWTTALMEVADAERCFAWALIANADEAETGSSDRSGGSTGAREPDGSPDGGRFTQLAVGKPSPFPALPEESFQVAFGATQAPIFLLGMRRPTANEVKGVRKDSLDVGLLPYGKHSAFVLLRGERITSDWMDAPFSVTALPPEQRGLPEREPHQGYLAQLILIDTRDNRVRAMRGISLSPSFCQAFQDEIARQSTYTADFSEPAYTSELRGAYAQLPRGSDMARRATIRERAGHSGVFNGQAASAA